MSDKNNGVSQDELDDYIHVAHMGIYIVIIALIIILTGWIIWVIGGKIPVTETASGLVIDMSDEDVKEMPDKSEYKPEYRCIVCLDAYEYNVEKLNDMKDDVKLQMPDGNVISGKIDYVESVPIARGTVAETYYFGNEWLVDECVPSYYNWIIAIKTDNNEFAKYPYSMAKATLVIDEVSPFSFLVR